MSMGYERNSVTPCTYWCETGECLLVHHGDNFLAALPEDRADSLEALMRA